MMTSRTAYLHSFLLAIQWRTANEKGPPKRRAFLTADTSVAGSPIYILVAGKIFCACFQLFARFSTGRPLDKFSTGGFSKESWSCNPSSWGADVRNSGTRSVRFCSRHHRACGIRIVAFRFGYLTGGGRLSLSPVCFWISLPATSRMGPVLGVNGIAA